MPKMHEILATLDDQKGQANKTTGDLISTFNNKSHLFRKKITTFQSFQEGVPAKTEAQSDIQTTLQKELSWVSDFIAKAIDSSHQVDLGNTQAKADIVVEDASGTEVLHVKDVPATSLLQLEKHLNNVRTLASAIPTLDPAQGFAPDEAAGKGIWRARDVERERTKKDKKVITLSAATEKFQAQVQMIDVDVPTGVIREQEWSALTTPAHKAEILNRCDTLIQAVKKARSRANSIDVDVSGNKIGKTLLNYVFQPLM